MKSHRARDGSDFTKKNYFCTFARRKKELKGQICVLKWLRLSIIEVLFGVELIESIVTTASVPPDGLVRCKDPSNSGIAESLSYGPSKSLNEHIPAGILTNCFRKPLVEVLYFKFCLSYMILEVAGGGLQNAGSQDINLTRETFRAPKKEFDQLIAFRRVYDVIWLVLNLGLDVTVFLISDSIEWAVVTALLIEGIRRALKI